MESAFPAADLLGHGDVSSLGDGSPLGWLCTRINASRAIPTRAYHLARIHRRMVHRATALRLICQQSVAVIQKQHAELLDFFARQNRLQYSISRSQLFSTGRYSTSALANRCAAACTIFSAAAPASPNRPPPANPARWPKSPRRRSQNASAGARNRLGIRRATPEQHHLQQLMLGNGIRPPARTARATGHGAHPYHASFCGVFQGKVSSSVTSANLCGVSFFMARLPCHES